MSRFGNLGGGVLGRASSYTLGTAVEGRPEMPPSSCSLAKVLSAAHSLVLIDWD